MLTNYIRQKIQTTNETMWRVFSILSFVNHFELQT
nr:MAG TPA: Poxvirus virion envelope protein A14 [Caudoviricetes sp.]